MEQQATWPERERICLACRTTVTEDEGCGCSQSALVSLRTIEGREELLSTVWGPIIPRRPTPWWVWAVIVVFGPLFMALQLAVEGVSLTFLIAAVMVTMVGTVGLVGFLKLVSKKAREQRAIDVRARTIALGASRQQLQLPAGEAVEGVVRAAAVARSPLTQRRCVAFSIELWASNADSSPNMLNDAATLGFEIATDQGEVITVKPGRIVLVGGRVKSVSAERSVVSYLTTLDPYAARDVAGTPFPFDRAHEVVLRDQERVRLLSGYTMRPDPRAPAAGYREQASVLREAEAPATVMIL